MPTSVLVSFTTSHRACAPRSTFDQGRPVAINRESAVVHVSSMFFFCFSWRMRTRASKIHTHCRIIGRAIQSINDTRSSLIADRSRDKTSVRPPLASRVQFSNQFPAFPPPLPSPDVIHATAEPGIHQTVTWLHQRDYNRSVVNKE